MPYDKPIGFITDVVDRSELASEKAEARFFLTPHLLEDGELFPYVIAVVKSDIQIFLKDKKFELLKKFGKDIYLLKNLEINK